MLHHLVPASALLLAVAAPPLPPPGEMERCLKLIQEREYPAARARLEPLVAAHPGWQRAVFFLGLAYHEELRYGEAEPLFARALALDGTSADVPSIRLHYGWCLYYLGQGEPARRQFEALLAQRPDHADAQFALGLIAFDADDVEQARSRFATTIALARASGDARTEGKARARLADVLVRTGDLAGARKELEAAVKLRPDAYEAYFKLSRVLERLGDPGGAAEARAMHQKVREQVRPSAPPP